MYIPNYIKVTADTNVWKLPYTIPCIYDIDRETKPSIVHKASSLEVELHYFLDTLAAHRDEKKIIAYFEVAGSELAQYFPKEIGWSDNFLVAITHLGNLGHHIEAANHTNNGIALYVRAELSPEEKNHSIQIAAFKDLLKGVSLTSPAEIDNAAGLPFNTSDMDKLRRSQYEYYRGRMDLAPEMDHTGRYWQWMTIESLENTNQFDENCLHELSCEFSFTKHEQEIQLLKSQNIPLELAFDCLLGQYKACNARFKLKARDQAWKSLVASESLKAPFPFKTHGIPKFAVHGKKTISWIDFTDCNQLRSIAAFTKENHEWNYVAHPIMPRQDVMSYKMNCSADIFFGQYWLTPETSRSLFIAGGINYRSKRQRGYYLPPDAHVFNAFAPAQTPLELSVKADLDFYKIIYQCGSVILGDKKKKLYNDNTVFLYETTFLDEELSYFIYAGTSLIDSLENLKNVSFGVAVKPSPPSERLYISSMMAGDLNNNNKMDVWMASICNGQIIHVDIIEETVDGLNRIICDDKWMNAILKNNQIIRLLAISTQRDDLLNIGYVVQQKKTDNDEEVYYPTVTVPVEPVEENKIYSFADQMPKFPGGDLEMNKFIASNKIYPEKAKTLATPVKVYVQFVVEKDGSLSNIKAISTQENSQDLILECERIVGLFPKFSPAMIRGQLVRCTYSLPIIFKIE